MKEIDEILKEYTRTMLVEVGVSPEKFTKECMDSMPEIDDFIKAKQQIQSLITKAQIEVLEEVRKIMPIYALDTDTAEYEIIFESTFNETIDQKIKQLEGE